MSKHTQDYLSAIYIVKNPEEYDERDVHKAESYIQYYNHSLNLELPLKNNKNELNILAMEKVRNCCLVIKQMIQEVPLTEKEFIKELEWNFEDARYKAPEQKLQWQRTQKTLIYHIPKPTEEWEFKVLSIFTTMTVDEIKKKYNMKNIRL